MGAAAGLGQPGRDVHGVPTRRRRASASARPSSLAEHDDALLAAYVEGRDRYARPAAAPRPPPRPGPRVLHPVFAGSAATGAGVPELMAGIATLLPGDRAGRRRASRRAGCSRSSAGAAGEKVAYVRMFSGSVRTRQRLDLPGGRIGKVAGIQVFEDGRWVRADEVGAGRIGRLHGLTAVRVGDGFGDSVPRRGAPLRAAHPRGVGRGGRPGAAARRCGPRWPSSPTRTR